MSSRSVSISQALLAGLAATIAMTMLMYVAPMMGMPKMDVAAMIGSKFGSGMPEPMSGPWILGMAIHILNGVVFFPLAFVFVLHSRLPGSSLVRGLAWGVLLWLVMQTMLMPMMGRGFFSSSAPGWPKPVVGSLIGHLVYGGVFGKFMVAPLGGSPVAGLPAPAREKEL